MALLRTNRTKQRLAEGRVAVGCLSLLLEPAVAEVLGATGYDFLIIDTDHVSAAGRDVEQTVRACEAVDVTPLVRARRVDEAEILLTLDAGAQGMSPGRSEGVRGEVLAGSQPLTDPRVDSPETRRLTFKKTATRKVHSTAPRIRRADGLHDRRDSMSADTRRAMFSPQRAAHTDERD